MAHLTDRRSYVLGQVRNLTIPGPVGRLQAALRHTAAPRAAAVVAHPHPLHGGTLDTPVIFHSDRELNRAGLATLRFNFRGVDESEGRHDEGRGEVDDVAAAVSWLRGVVFDVPMLLVGFSFGSLCAVRYALHDPAIVGLVAIGLPVLSYPCDELAHFRRPLGVVQGELDEFGGPEAVREVIDGLDPPGRLYTVDSTTHLFPERARDAGLEVVRAADEILG